MEKTDNPLSPVVIPKKCTIQGINGKFRGAHEFITCPFSELLLAVEAFVGLCDI